MPEGKTSFIIVSDTFVSGEHHPKGTKLELDIDNSRQAGVLAQLHAAGRIAVATPKVVEQIESELRDAAKESRRQSKPGKGPEE